MTPRGADQTGEGSRNVQRVRLPVTGDLQDTSWSAHLDDARFDALQRGEMTITLTVRRALKTVTAVLHPLDGERFSPANVRRRRVSMYLFD